MPTKAWLVMTWPWQSEVPCLINVDYNMLFVYYVSIYTHVVCICVCILEDSDQVYFPAFSISTHYSHRGVDRICTCPRNHSNMVVVLNIQYYIYFSMMMLITILLMYYNVYTCVYIYIYVYIDLWKKTIRRFLAVIIHVNLRLFLFHSKYIYIYSIY